MDRKTIAVGLAIALAAPAEGLRNWAYKDPVGLPTICYGSTHGVHLGDWRSNSDCVALLNKEMLDVVEQVDRCQPGLPPNVLAAFSDAAYNIGSIVACDTDKSTAARLLRAGDIRGACEQLPKWNKATIAGVKVVLPGLTKRREMERELCLQNF